MNLTVLLEEKSILLSGKDLLTLKSALHLALSLNTFLNTGKLDYDYLYSKLELELNKREEDKLREKREEK